jgi:hypothetical protein
MHPLSLKVMTWSWGLFGAVTSWGASCMGWWVPRAFHLFLGFPTDLPGLRLVHSTSVLRELGRPRAFADLGSRDSHR